MSESLGIDSPFRGLAMPKSYSADLRGRVIEAVEMGASRHEAAERFEVNASSAVKALAGEWEHRDEAARRQRFSAGEVRSTGTGCDSRTSGPDVGGDSCRAAPTAQSNQ